MDSPYLPVILEKMIGDREDPRRGLAEYYDLTVEEAYRYTRYLRESGRAD